MGERRMRTVTLKDLMFELDQALDNHALDPDLTGMTEQQGRAYVAALARAYREVYETPFVWPESQQGKTVNLTNGRFSVTDIDRGDWWQVWTADPRPVGSRAVFIASSLDSDGIWAKTTAASVFVQYRPAAPRLIYRPVQNANYATGQIIYDPVTGDCYEAITANAPGTSLSDETKWRRSLLMHVLREPVTLLAAGHIQEGSGNTERAQRLYDRSRAKREVEFSKAFEGGQN